MGKATLVIQNQEGDTLNIDLEKPVQGAMQERCAVRLANDASSLEAKTCGRMQVSIRRFGPRVIGAGLRFPSVKTAFRDRASGEVVVREAAVFADIRPNSGNVAPYPFGPPQVSIDFPGLASGGAAPWLPGLLWLDDTLMADADPITIGLGLLQGFAPGRPVGIPCLWRQGGWTPDCDLVFVARQVHRMLADPGDYSPTDAMNAEAALHWATHKQELPFETPIPELYGEVRTSGKAAQRASRFTLVPLE